MEHNKLSTGPREALCMLFEAISRLWAKSFLRSELPKLKALLHKALLQTSIHFPDLPQPPIQTDDSGPISRCMMLFTAGGGMTRHILQPCLLRRSRCLLVLHWPMMLSGKLISKLCSSAANMQSVKTVKHTEEPVANEPTLTTPYIGRVNVWLSHTPPWVPADATPRQIEKEAQLLCDVSWYKYRGVQPGLYNCPVVSKNFLDCADGNSEFADNLEPAAVSIVPYIGRNFAVANSQQVIVTDVSIFKPRIS